MSLSPPGWHRRFLQQSGWTQQLRQYLLSRLELPPASRVLEAGCGTGAITASLREDTPARVYGLDLNLPFLRLARQNDPVTRFTAGDALRLPFTANSFDAAVCHFLLLWVSQPADALAELLRVTRPGGVVIAFAEPDYGGRIDHPPALAELGRLQAEALRQQGAGTDMGRQLSGLFHAAGLRNIETGLLGAQWQGPSSSSEVASEWAALESDLAGKLTSARRSELRQVDAAARQTGQRVLFVPTFYAIGYKPDAK